MMAATSITPADIGLPKDSWRAGQWEMVCQIAEWEQTPHQMLVAPTGFGKSLTYMGIAALTGWRVGVLTETRALQDQLMADFEQVGLIDIKGQTNYRCNAATTPSAGLFMYFRRDRQYTAREGPCRRGITCPLREGGCDYYDRIRAAAAGQLWVANYDFWFHNRGALGPLDLLVMDEAHGAPDKLAGHLSFRLTHEKLKVLKAAWPTGEDVREWARWANWAVGRIEQMLEAEATERNEAALRELKWELERAADMLTEGEWVVEHGPREVAIDCINPEDFGRTYLWPPAQVKRTLMVSATVNKTTAKAVGMDPAQVKLWDAPSGFPVERRPVYVVRDAPRLSFRSTEGDKVMWAALANRIMKARGDRKGIFHTVSFDRAKYMLGRLQQGVTGYLNESRNTAVTVANFRRARTGVLISPSVTTGWDFPGDECEYQIIGKIPFPDLRSKAAKARAHRHKEWAGYVAAQVLVQSSGRGMRSAEDQCETFIIDGNFDWWMKANYNYLPRWWLEAVRWVDAGKIPDPPSKLTGKQGRT